MYRWKMVMAALLWCFSIMAFCTEAGYCIAHKVVAEGGPYVCKSTNKLQKFRAAISVPESMLGDPLWLTFYNGYGNRQGFSWVRVFLGDPGQTAFAGHVLADERTFVQHRAATINVSGRFNQKPRSILIEGEGQKGAIFSWVLTSVKSNLSVLSTTSLTPGKTCMIHGTGFSTNTSQNQVLLNGKSLQVISSTPRILKVQIPKKVKSQNASLQVNVNGKRSNKLRVAISIIPPVLVSMSPYGGPAGGVLNIRGANFSRLASNNVVKIGPYTAPVIKVMDTGTLLCRIPNWGASVGTLPVTIAVNGIPARNHLSFWCVPHYYGGNPNAEIYSYD